ncbi:MAG: CPBP family intramembrane metalloprotease [Bacilli bacterium]|nr:CPBP family intramembrane metalloprotease [Bacilli bacterium]
MEKIKNFFKEIGKSLLVFLLYLGLVLILSNAFKNLIKSSNFWISNLIAILVELIVLFVLFLIYRKRIIVDFKEYKNNIKNIMSTSLKNWIIGLIVMLVSNVIISFITGNIANNEEMNRSLLVSTPLYAITAMVFIAPITEEIIFRLSPRKAFNKKMPYLIYSAIFFGAMHLLSSTSLIELLYVIPYGALGFFFAKSYYETNNIFSSISTHMIHNTVAVILAYMALLG